MHHTVGGYKILDMSNPHKNAIKQLQSVAKELRKQYKDKNRFDAAIKKLSETDRIIETELEITLENGKKKKYKAFRSQHNNSRGPYKGGIRFHQNVTLEEVKALSTWMTWKCAVTGIPYGGGKGGIIVNPKELSEAELERLSRAYARSINEYIGPWIDIPAPDVNTTPQIMAWMVDEIENLRTKRQSHHFPQTNLLATFTGKPLALGGSEGREEATGLGGVFVLEKLFEKLVANKILPSERKKDVTIAIQGFGNVGYWFAYHADKLGYRVVAVSDSKTAIYVERGLDPVKTLQCKKESGNLSSCMCSQDSCDLDLGREISNQELLELNVDILVPAALENVIDKENANKIKAKAIIEMANGPITPEADEILAKNKVIVIPDILANAGGVTTSYFEWIQNLQGYYWEKSEVIEKLKPLMQTAFERMWQQKEKSHTDGRTATYMSAVKSVIDTMFLRGRV